MAIILIRTLIIFLALIVAMRLMGKRQLGELELSELVVAVLIADIASIPLQNPSLRLTRRGQLQLHKAPHVVS